MTLAEWEAEGGRRFGPNKMQWRFVCPVCKHVAAVQDWYDAGHATAAAYSCIGRYLTPKRDAFDGKGPGPCNYAGGGLFRRNPVDVVMPDGVVAQMFAFADVPAASAEAAVP